ncbi:hypothetical protein JOF53_002861 [Crossiella equi]|uniref:DUF6895 domain-containing protein n=1 Tax=Crossiella equi TaxID=130796 RepID=A0ABS5ABM4_9PSEU|nr:hypothetical protein [Crossiella equi]MBP2473989.1 hypothetical protein [Crossiella equi]
MTLVREVLDGGVRWLLRRCAEVEPGPHGLARATAAVWAGTRALGCARDSEPLVARLAGEWAAGRLDPAAQHPVLLAVVHHLLGLPPPAGAPLPGEASLELLVAGRDVLSHYCAAVATTPVPRPGPELGVVLPAVLSRALRQHDLALATELLHACARLGLPLRGALRSCTAALAACQQPDGRLGYLGREVRQAGAGADLVTDVQVPLTAGLVWAFAELAGPGSTLVPEIPRQG